MIVPADLLALAKKQLGNDEASNRSAVSRAYYACYHDVRATAMKQLGYSNYTGVSGHKHLRKYLLKHENTLVKAIGRDMIFLLRERVKADYKLDQNLSKKHSALIVAKASILIKDLHKI